MASVVSVSVGILCVRILDGLFLGHPSDVAPVSGCDRRHVRGDSESCVSSRTGCFLYSHTSNPRAYLSAPHVPMGCALSQQRQPLARGVPYGGNVAHFACRGCSNISASWSTKTCHLTTRSSGP